MSRLSESVAQSIKQQQLKPIPRWRLLLESRFVWGLVLLSIIIGAVAVAILLHQILIPIDDMTKRPVGELLSQIPLFWIVVLLLFAYVAYHNFIHTEEGYRWKTVQILIGTIIVSVLLGSVLFTVGIGRKVNDFMVAFVPGYTRYGDLRGRGWMNPAEGRLVGIALGGVNADKEFRLEDPAGKIWLIRLSEPISDIGDINKGLSLRIYGKIESESVFIAYEITTWEGRGRRLMQENGLQKRIPL